MNSANLDVKDYVKKTCIALTGGIATGKSRVAALLKSMHYTVVDADQLAREAVEKENPTLLEIQRAFGANVIGPDGALNRKLLRDIISNDTERKSTLEAIMHPAIETLFFKKAEEFKKQDKSLWFYEAALIFEKNKTDWFRSVWLTTCPPEEQVRRLMARDGLSRSETERMIATQARHELKASKAHVIIDTSLTDEELSLYIAKHLPA